MEENKVDINSCLMLACALYTPVSLSSVFDDKDLKDAGIELESHITLLFAQGIRIPRENIMKDIETILVGSKYDGFIDILKNSEDNNGLIEVLRMFDLGLFENDSDYVVLKLRQDNELYKTLKLINTGLRNQYNVSSEFTYTPHLSLAELNPGTAKKYMESKKLMAVLKESKFAVEDIVISYGPSGVPEDREKYNLTHFHAVERYFREENLKREEKD